MIHSAHHTPQETQRRLETSDSRDVAGFDVKGQIVTKTVPVNNDACQPLISQTLVSPCRNSPRQPTPDGAAERVYFC